MKKVFVIPDIHAPFQHNECLAWIYSRIKVEKPDIVCQIGDLLDMYAASKFAKSHDIMTPKQELAEGRMVAEAMWKNVALAAPKARLLQFRGNHDIRPDKRIQEACPELESLLNTQPLYQFKGVETFMDPRAEVEIDGVIYIHGYLTKIGDHCRYFLQPVVHGHSHRGGTFFTRIRNQNIWELDCGFCSDESAVPLRYTPTRRTLWTLGYGSIDDYGPRFVPYECKRTI